MKFVKVGSAIINLEHVEWVYFFRAFDMRADVVLASGRQFTLHRGEAEQFEDHLAYYMSQQSLRDRAPRAGGSDDAA